MTSPRLKSCLGGLMLLAFPFPVIAAKPALVQAGLSASYRCADGRTIEVLYSGAGDAVLTIGDVTVAMRSVAAADGVRYVGPGWQWWAKGRADGALSPLRDAETIAGTGTRCAAR